jgi:hypothetical protein
VQRLLELEGLGLERGEAVGAVVDREPQAVELRGVAELGVAELGGEELGVALLQAEQVEVVPVDEGADLCTGRVLPEVVADDFNGCASLRLGAF